MSRPIVHQIVSGTWRQNGYVVEGADGANALIVDPGTNLAGLRAAIAGSGCRPVAILNTHAHYDHIGSVVVLAAEYGIPFYLHKADAALLRQANLYRALFGETETLFIPSSFLDLSGFADGTLEIGGFASDIIVTPGHTKGSTCFLIGDLLFTGDTLMGNGPGRVDLPGGSAAAMEATQARLATLPGSLIVHPGHGRIEALAEIRRRTAAV